MRLKNSTSISNDLVKEIVRFARPPGISKFSVTLTNKSRGAWRGRGGRDGILIRVNVSRKYPMRLWTYQYGQLKGRRYYIASLTEALIYLITHELMHTKQGQAGRFYGRRGNRHSAVRGRVYGARGRFSEIECESYAIRKLREWRRNH